MRVRIRLDTLSDVHKFVAEMNLVEEKVWLEDDEGNCVSSKSLLGVLYSMEWDRIYCYCKTDISYKLMRWMV